MSLDKFEIPLGDEQQYGEEVSEQRECTIAELIDELDGSGLIITDDTTIEETLAELGFTWNSKVTNK